MSTYEHYEDFQVSDENEEEELESRDPREIRRMALMVEIRDNLQQRVDFLMAAVKDPEVLAMPGWQRALLAGIHKDPRILLDEVEGRRYYLPELLEVEKGKPIWVWECANLVDGRWESWLDFPGYDVSYDASGWGIPWPENYDRETESLRASQLARLTWEQGQTGDETLFDAYRQAHRLGTSIRCDLAEGSDLSNGRTEDNLTVADGLVNGLIAVQQGLTSDWIFVLPARAREVRVDVW